MTAAPSPSTEGYAWPLLPLLDVIEAARILAERLQAAYDDLEADRLRLLALALAAGRPAIVRPYIADFQAQIQEFLDVTSVEVVSYIRNHLVPRYEEGIHVVSPDRADVWLPPHAVAVTSLATDTYGDFLRRSQDAGRTAEQFAEEVREVSSAELPKIAAGGRTAVQVGRRLERRLVEEYDVREVTYADDSRVSVRTYAQMVARTKSAVAYNAGTVNECQIQAVEYVEVLDGIECGWASHKDADKANRTFRTTVEAAAHPISHPNCRRAFGPRPDITTPEEARTATPFQRAPEPDPLPAVPADPVRRRRGAEVRRARLAEQRAARSSGASTAEVADAIVRRLTDD